MPLTTSQAKAIRARGNVIVVAGAGTGKTSTLVERCVALLAEGCSIENILMVTFTDAAAAEMRHRLRVRLAEVASESQSDAARHSWWLEQTALLETARICTLHSFCLQLIRENFHLLGIDPTVKILDEQQVRPLIETALDASLEQPLRGTDAKAEAVRELIRVYGRGDLAGVRTLVLKLHRYAQSLATPAHWFDSQLEMFAHAEPQAWRHWFVEGVRQWAAWWLPDMAVAADSARNLSRCADSLRKLEAAKGIDDIGGEVAEILHADEADWPPKLKTKLREPFKKFFEEAAFLASQFQTINGADGLASDWHNVRTPMGALLLLTRQFGDAFALAKREAGGIDFADLEQFALRLLWDAEGQLTVVARRCQAALAHVFVDECQDINGAQDAILRAVSCGHAPSQSDAPDDAVAGNRFLVGDVKQSIYQFRLARPALFLGYERDWNDAKAGQRIPLSDNFRSAPEIIGFVNALFAPLMRESLGGVEYLPLRAGRAPECTASSSKESAAVEFHLIPKTVSLPMRDEVVADEEGKATGGEDDLLAIEREARLVALRLSELHRSGLEIWDKEFGRLRRVEWRDMAVLLRSPSNRIEAFAQEFHRCGVPLQAARGGFLQSTEINDLLSLLRLLDNPLQDIPLLAVLRSPLVAMSLDELAEVRIASREKRFWIALQAFHRAAPKPDASAAARSGWEKLDEFMGRFMTWRELVRQTSLSHCLERALGETGYEALIQAGERGMERLANVQRLIRMVREYDPYQRQGLFRFLRHVDSLIEAKQDVPPAPAPTQNAVRLMSIHQSKGLEFPVVAVACLGGLFNLGDLHQDILLDEEYGLCAKAVTAGAATRYPTLSHWLAARRQRKQSLGEELRLLYVATTRARDRLLLTATATRKDCESWECVGARDFGERELVSARSPLDWLLLWLPTVTATGDWNGDGGVNKLLRWRIWREAGDWDLQEQVADALPDDRLQGTASDGNTVEAVVQRIRWRYSKQTATVEPAKTSVTALRRKAAAELLDEDAASWFSGAKRRPTRPQCSRELGAAKVGTLHHQFLQRMDLSGACDLADLQAQLAKMVQRGQFGADEAAAIDIPRIVGFWSGKIGQMILREREWIRREEPFTARFSPVELQGLVGATVAAGMEDEFVVVQGVADLLVVRENELWLLDFKTDELRKADLESKAALYEPQLKLYAAALEGIHRKPVVHRWLHFLRVGETLVV